MVHLTLNQTPICETAAIKCQYSNKREALAVKSRYAARYPGLTLAPGPCPNILPTPHKETRR
jgi:hypothetical protein